MNTNPLHEHDKSKTLESFKDLYTDRSFFEDHYGLHTAAKYTGFVMQCVSALSGWAAPYSIILAAFGVSAILSHVLAGIAAGLIVLGLEVVSFLLTKAFFKSRYKGTASGHVGFGMLLVVGLSLFFSWYGGGVLTEKLDTRRDDYTQKFALDTALQFSDLRAQIARAEADKAADLKRFEWAGKVDVSNPAVKAVIASHAANLNALRERQKNAVETAETAFLAKTDKLKASEQSAVRWSSIIAACAVVVFMLSMWYVYYFGFVSYLEATQTSEPKQDQAQAAPVVMLPTVVQAEPTPVQINAPEPDNGWEQGQNDRIAAGFKIQQIDVKKPVKVAGGWQITCYFCGTVAVKSQPTAKFCSDKCRLDHHNAKTTVNKFFTPPTK